MNSGAAVSLPERGSLAYFSVLSLIAALGGLLFGFDTAVISGANEFLKNQFEMGPAMQGWVVSSALVGCLIGAGLGGWLSDRFGRKLVLILAALLFMTTAVGIALAPEPIVLSVARLIGGLGVGIASMVVPLYLAEIAPAHLRGRTVSCYQFAITVGILAAYFSNHLLLQLSRHAQGTTSAWAWYQWMVVDQVWRAMLGSLLLPSGLFLILLAFVPESPRWLVKQGAVARALAILARIGGRREAETQMAEIQATIEHEGGDWRQIFQGRERRVLVMAVFLACSAQLSGINAIIYYGPTIFQNAGFEMGDALGGQVILGVVNVVFTLLAMWKVDTLGRRPLLLVGNLGVFLSLAAVGTLFAVGVKAGAGLVFFISAYLACFAFSLGPIPWIFMSEVFPTRIRGRAISVATLSLWLANTIVCQAFPVIDKRLGPATTFWIFAAMVMPTFYFALRVMPETKGRSLEEIENDLYLREPA